MPRGDNAWTRALKQWNAGKPAYCIPKKGTAQYREVHDIAVTLGLNKRKTGGKSSAHQGSAKRRRVTKSTAGKRKEGGRSTAPGPATKKR